MNTLEARREARRQKILRNAESRLHKIMGVQNQSQGEPNIETVPNSSDQPHDYVDRNNIETDTFLNNSISSIETEERIHNFDKIAEKQSNNINGNIQQQEEEEEYLNNATSNLFITNLCTIYGTQLLFLIGIITSLLSNFNFVLIERIFLPFIAFEILIFTIIPIHECDDMSILLLLKLLNLNNEIARRFSKVFYYTKQLFQSLIIYFFAYSTCELLMHFIFSKIIA